MTRPLYEPTPPRMDAYLDFQQQQLFRRPAPDVCPCPVQWALAEDADQDNVSNNTLTVTTFTGYAIGASVTAIEIESATQPFKLVESGWYQFWAQVEWAGSGFADVRMNVMTKSGGGFFLDTASSTYFPRTISSDPYLAGVVGSWGPLYANCNAVNNIKLGLSVQHRSGGTETRNTVQYAVVYLGPAMDIPDYDPSWVSNHLVAF